MTNGKVYVGGSLFKEADIKQRIYEEETLKEFGFTDIFNPITAPFNTDKSTMPTPEQIYNGDLQQIIDSNYIMAALDDNDPGLAVEIGIVAGYNYLADEISTLLDECEDIKDLVFELKKIKRKTIFATCNDIRIPDAHRYNYPSWGINHFLLGAVLENGFIDKSAKESITTMKRHNQIFEGV